MADPKQLPIRQHAADIADAVRNNSCVVVIGETGSGKTTQISQILQESGLAGDGMIGVTQPRRVAAVSVARRVAEEMGVQLGREVGYAVRFEDRTSSATRIKYLTDGTLLRELLHDPVMSKYSILILDEAHERSLNTDILFGLLKSLALDRSDKRTQGPLKLVVTSATLDAEKFGEYFGGCPVFRVPGRTFPVRIVHSLENHLTDYEAAVVDTALDIHCNHPPGDILAFLTGQAEIDKAVRALNESVSSLPSGAYGDLVVFPLYAALPPELQARIFSPPSLGVRRCVIATNIAETSVTVDGVVYVIDPGVVKQKQYDPRSGMDALGVVPISRVQAAQRTGRAGRTQPGVCFRLYTKKYHENEMPDTTPPEIQRTSLVGAVLYLKSLSLDIDVLGFEFLDPPARSSLEDALRQLYVLDALDQDGVITSLGRSMASLPLDPALSRAALAAKDLGCLPEMLTVAAMLSPEGNVFVGHHSQGFTRWEGGPGKKKKVTSESDRGDVYSTSPKKSQVLEEMMADGAGDHILLLRVYNGWEAAGESVEWCKRVGVDFRAMRYARDVRRQLERVLRDVEDDDLDDHTRKKRRRELRSHSPSVLRDVRKALTLGFANRIARRMPLHNGYRTVGGEKSVVAQVHPAAARLTPDADGLLPEWIVYHELVSTSRVYLSGVCPVEGTWVKNLLAKLHDVDVIRLSGAASAGARQINRENGHEDAKEMCSVARRNDDDAVRAARARYLARRSSFGGGAKPGKR